MQLPVLACVAAGVAIAYISQEQWYYGSDYSFYHVMTWFTTRSVLENPLLAPFLIWLSTGTAGHDVVFTIGLLPFSMVFGDSRSAFIAAIASMYLAPYVFIHALIMRNLYSSPAKASTDAEPASADAEPPSADALLLPPGVVQWTTALLALSIPTLWAPCLRGYPDVGAAAIVIFCVLLYLADMERPSWRRLLLIGFLLGLAPLFRRHYVYAAFAFALATVLHSAVACLLVRSERGDTVSYIKGAIRRIALIGVAGALTLGTFGFFFIQEKIKHFYMYAGTSASVSLTEALGYFITSYGIVAWLCAIAGYVAAFRMGAIDRNKGAFLMIFGMSSALTWILLAQQMATHYTLYATPFIVWGVALLVLTLLASIQEGRAKANALSKTALAMFALYAAVNLIVGFTPANVLSRGLLAFVQPSDLGMLSFPRRHGNVIGRLFSASYAPLHRDDGDVVVSFVRELQKLARHNEPILIGDASDLLHRDMVENVERQLNGGMTENRLNLWGPPFLNSRDSYPLERIISARYAAIASPIYPLYNEADAHILNLLVSSFLDRKPITRDFEELPQQFKFDRGVTVRLYKRVRGTPASDAVLALEEFKKALPRRPGGQPPWISTDDPSEQDTEETRDYFELEPCQPGSANLTHYLLSAHDLPEHFFVSGKVAGRLDAKEKRINRQYGTLYDDMPKGYALVCRLIDRNGRQLDEMKMPDVKAKGTFVFAIPLEQRDAAYVVLSIEDAHARGDLLQPDYKIKLESLKISPANFAEAPVPEPRP